MSFEQLPPSVREVLVRYQSLLRERFKDRLAELRLFGSFARQEAREDSDIDVLVVIDGLTESERDDAIDLAYDARSESDWVDLSPIVYSKAQAADLRGRERALLRAIDAEGIAL